MDDTHPRPPYLTRVRNGMQWQWRMAEAVSTEDRVILSERSESKNLRTE